MGRCQVYLTLPTAPCGQAKVSAPTRAGRALRRSLLSGCVVVVVVAGYSGKRFIYERAHELGIRCKAFPMSPIVMPAQSVLSWEEGMAEV